MFLKIQRVFYKIKKLFPKGKYIIYVINCVLQLIYDNSEICIVCNENIYDENMICPKCKKQIKFCNEKSYIKAREYEFESYTLAYYSGIIKNMILRLKYRSDFNCAEVLGNYLTDLIVKNDLKFDLITFVPMTKSSLKHRGYNQSELLAKIISRNTNIKIVKCLNKISETKDQIGLDGKSRWENMKNCFEFNNLFCIKGKKILLVDDVITTGATACYCSTKLVENNAKEILVLTVAKSKV